MNEITKTKGREKTISIPEFLSGGGEMGRLIREFDWSKTSLGSVETWPHSLRTCIRIMLTSRQPIWIGWGKELIKFYNDPYKAIVGGKHPWALGKPASVVWKDIWRDIEPMLKQVMEQDEGTYVESQLLIMERNGYPEETYYTFSYTPIPSDSGKTEGMFCANTDDTDKIISERQLRTLTQLGKRLADCRSNAEIVEETMTTLQENPHDFPFALFRTVTNTKAILSGSTPLGESEKFISKEVDLSADNEVVSTIKNAIASRKPQLFEGLNEKFGPMPRGAWEVSPNKLMVLPIIQTGSKEPYGLLIVGLNPYRLLDEKYTGFFALIADQVATSFADVHILEEERKRTEALAEINRAKTAFFSNISHEFRTPLTLMAAPIEDALNDPNTVPENRLRLSVAQSNVKRLQKLVNALLDFSRIEAGRMQARFERVNVSSLTKDLASTFRATVEKAGMQLNIDCGENIEAYVDVDMWEKIVLNLLSNAFKYTYSGSITLRLKQESDRIYFSVTDTGVGIPETELQKVFERFHRVHNASGRSQEGTGIGLALVQELVKLHQASIHVQSKLKEGTTFTVTLLAGKNHLPAEQIVLEQSSLSFSASTDVFIDEAMKWLPSENHFEADPPSTSVSTRRPSVLLADDNTDMREYLQRLLSTSYQVTAVSNGKLALENAIALEPDLILSDVMMPEMSGFELVKHLKEHPKTKNTPVVLLSARAGEEATIEGLQTGADDYLVKPFSARELLSRIDSNIKIAQSRITAFRQLYNLFMNAPVAIAILRKKEQRFELANERYLEIAGKDDVVGKTLHEAFPELKGTGVEDLLNNVYTSGVPFYGNEFEVTLLRKGKLEKVFFNFAYTPMLEIDGTIGGVMVVAVDVTEMILARKVLEQNEARLEGEVQKRTEELQEINEALERSNKELEQYAFVTSHDLQEPLRKIQTFATLLYERNAEKLDEKSVQHYEKVVQAARRMSTLINDLLNFSRLTKLEQFVPVDLNEIFKNVTHDFELVIQEKNVVIRAAELPVVEAIPLQMNQLFGNLLSNAIKFSATDQTPEIRIEAAALSPAEKEQHLSLFPDKDFIKISFNDNGIGFDPVYSEKIFEIFQRLHNRAAYEGTGIGLALCARIVANHHGVIFAKGEKEKGASFYVILPLKQNK
ncbi:ATP-binding protein [Flavisolibacter ginsenosidimutans]|uniref:histidine kinase n=1 Tax=Flavisolibacter ginsenosidimutans TaxID=661481 RepID=A0A5B8UFT1_9BACT|nr:ATP-binding protein [Flavisolibacter ginsenosidimutans]QEC55235.1 response regulator [Flavisolibacter ginsenosidimutans]